MTDPFTLVVVYKGEELQLPAQLVLQGYTHKFTVQVQGNELYFEPDEEGQYRVITPAGQHLNDFSAIDKQLLSLVQQRIAEILA
ncbi:MAG: hypothetical protein ABIU63_09160 [Chitinophagaceae bacterium]